MRNQGLRPAAASPEMVTPQGPTVSLVRRFSDGFKVLQLGSSSVAVFVCDAKSASEVEFR
jgi:hypothetical protein